jgi:SAM-dependent methyltransferase
MTGALYPGAAQSPGPLDFTRLRAEAIPRVNPVSLATLRRQAATLQVAERFFDSAILFALFELGIFAALASGRKTLDDLHERTRGDRYTLEAILDAAVALRMLSRRDGAYEASGALLDCLGQGGSPQYVGEWISWLHAVAPSLLRLAESVRSGEPGITGDLSPSGGALDRIRTRAMDVYARTHAPELAERIDFSAAKTLLDLGCGSGAYSFAIVERHPDISATLLDVPEAIAEARAIAARRGLAERLEFVAGDAQTRELGRSFDAVLVSNVLHMLGAARSRALLRRCYELLRPGGRIIVQGQFLDEDRTSPRWAALLNLILRAVTREGRNHSAAEGLAWLRETGFADAHHVRFSPWNANSALLGSRGN